MYCFYLILCGFNYRDIAARVSYYVINDSQDTPVIRVLDNGQLRSGSAPGNAFLHVVSEEEFGINQTLVILVKVNICCSVIYSF